MKLIAALICTGLTGAAAAATASPESRSAHVAGLPLVEVPASVAPAPAESGRLAVMLSGDGGWASLDKSIAAGFARRGIPAVGVNSLRYFWNGRKPEEAAADVAAVIEEYAQKWHQHRVDLVGYSFGADVLPFIVNRLPAGTAARLATITLIEPSDSATFEIHLSDWLPGVVTPGLPLAPEVRQLRPAPLCLHGDEAQSVCSGLPAGQVARIGAGHHLGGDGEPIVERILQ